MTTAKTVVSTAEKYLNEDGTRFWKDYGPFRCSTFI